MNDERIREAEALIDGLACAINKIACAVIDIEKDIKKLRDFVSTVKWEINNRKRETKGDET